MEAEWRLLPLHRKWSPDMSGDAKDGALRTIDEILGDQATCLWLKAALRSALLRDPVDAC